MARIEKGRFGMEKHMVSLGNVDVSNCNLMVFAFKDEFVINEAN